MSSDVEDRVRSIISRVSGVDAEKITPETRLAADLGLSDSQIAELIEPFQDAFGMEIPNDEAEKSVVGRVVEYIQSKLGGA